MQYIVFNTLLITYIYIYAMHTAIAVIDYE